MSYQPIQQLDPIPEDRDADSSETDMEFGKSESDETLSFLRWKRSGEAHARWALSRRRPDNNCVGVTSCLIPWIINLILAISLVSVVWKFDSEPTVSHLPPKDLLYSECQQDCTERASSVGD